MMRSLFVIFVLGVAVAACDDSTDLTPAPHDSGAEAGDAGDAGDAGNSDASSDAPVDAPDAG
jgi:hypothetical protein